MKVKSTKRMLLSSILALAMCFSMLVGTTFAWFTDSVTTGSNVIKSGNLDIEVEYTLGDRDKDDELIWNKLDGAKDLFQKDLWEPGHTEVVALRIKNVGSLALKYSASMNIASETIGKNKAGEDIVLSEILTVSTVTHQVNMIGDILLGMVFGGSQNTDAGVEKSFRAGNVLEADQELMAGEAHYLIITVDMAETVGNDANHDGVNVPMIDFGVNVFATQYTYENDSFGNQYDKDATYDDYWDVNAVTDWYYANPEAAEFTLNNANDLAGLAKLVNTGVDTFAGQKITLAQDVELNNIAWWPIGINVYPFAGTFDGNGKTINNLYVETNSDYAGLFGYVAVGATISNFTMENVAVVDSIPDDDVGYYGAVVGFCPGAMTLKDIAVTGNIQINSEWYVGGLIGRSKGATISNCSVNGADGSVISSGRWAAGISGYDNGAMVVTNCTVENVTIEAKSYVGGIAALGAVNAKVRNNTAKNIHLVLKDAEAENTKTFGTLVSGVSVYSYSAAPVYASDNTVENVTCTVNGEAVAAQEFGSKYADGTDQGLVMMPTVKLGDGYYTYLKKAIEAAPKDGSVTVIELTGDAIITGKFKPSVAKNQNIVIKTNGYNLIWVQQDANKVPVTDADGNLVTTVVTAENMSSYITVKSGGACVIE